jgi:hypothetical protein
MNLAFAPFFSSIFDLESYILAIQHGYELKDLGIWMIREAKSGHPISDAEKEWMRELMRESDLKIRHMILNRLYACIPDRIINSNLWKLFITTG